MLKQLNTMMICLIPKFDRSENASQFRQFHAVILFIKCISKILCNRLNCVLPELVNPTQASFVKGRSLIQNFLVCHDLLRHYKRKTTPNSR